MNIVEIPLDAGPQRLRVVLNGKSYQLRVYWNIPANCWLMDIADTNSVPLANGLAMVTGVNLLTQLNYLDIGLSNTGAPGQFLVVSDHQPDLVPGWSDFGVNGTGHLFFLNAW
jgi:hypothetical protein